MKSFTKKGFLQKMIISICIVILTSGFIVPNYSQADVGGVLLSPIVDLLCTIGDLAINVVQVCLGGDFSTDTSFSFNAFMIADDEYTSTIAALPDKQKEKINNMKTKAKKTETLKIDDGEPDEFTRGWLGLSDRYYIPVVTYSPEEIFAGEVPGLDSNFISPKYSESENGLAAQLQKVISGWYVALRNLATVGLLCVLAYVGIRMILSSTAGDKAKYKQMFMDWLIALCLLFVLHYIMNFTITIVDSVVTAIKGDGTNNIKVVVETSESTPVTFGTNLLGLARFKTQYDDVGRKLTFLVMYLFLVYYTIYFSFVYLKRALTLAFLTIIAPIVAFTYPIDKLNDGKAQAFNSWLREYIYNVLIQPFHLILYYVLVTSAMELVSTNLIYAIVAIAFIPQAEKLLRKFFGFDSKAPSLGNSMAGVAMAATASNVIGNAKKLVGAGSSGKSGGASGDAAGNGGKTSDANPVRYKRPTELPDVNGRGTQPGIPGTGGNKGPEGLPNGEGTNGALSEEQRKAMMEAEFARQSQNDDETDSSISNERIAQNQRAQAELQHENNNQLEGLNEAQEQELQKKKFRMKNLMNANIGNRSHKGKAIKGAVKFAAGTTFKAAGMLVGGTAGMIAGAASGKGVDAMLAGMTGGAVAGRVLGGKAANAGINVVGKAGSAIGKTGRFAGGVISDVYKGTKQGIQNEGGAKGALKGAGRGIRDNARSHIAGTKLGETLDTAYGDNRYAKMAGRQAFKTNDANRQYIQDMLSDEKGTGEIVGKDEVEDYMNKLDAYADEGLSIDQAVKAHELKDEFGMTDEMAARVATWSNTEFDPKKVETDEKKEKYVEKLAKEYEANGMKPKEALQSGNALVDFSMAMRDKKKIKRNHKPYSPTGMTGSANDGARSQSKTKPDSGAKLRRGRPPKMRTGTRVGVGAGVKKPTTPTGNEPVKSKKSPNQSERRRALGTGDSLGRDSGPIRNTKKLNK